MEVFLNTRYVYKVEDVTNTALGFPAFAARTWREHNALREFFFNEIESLFYLNSPDALSACEVGCGYARMTPVLREFATEVVGFEREPHFRDIARALHPEIKFPETNDIWNLNAIDFEFDLTMTWTFLQHVHECHIKQVAKEISRITKEWLLICEETTHPKMVTNDLGQHICTGRLPGEYQELFPDFFLIRTIKRPIDDGELMLFGRK